MARHITTLTFSIPKFWTVKYVYSFSASTVQLHYEIKLQGELPIWFVCGREVRACALKSEVLGWILQVAMGTLFHPFSFFMFQLNHTRITSILFSRFFIFLHITVFGNNLGRHTPALAGYSQASIRGFSTTCSPNEPNRCREGSS